MKFTRMEDVNDSISVNIMAADDFPQNILMFAQEGLLDNYYYKVKGTQESYLLIYYCNCQCHQGIILERPDSSPLIPCAGVGSGNSWTKVRNSTKHMGCVMEVRLSCYLVLLSKSVATRQQPLCDLQDSSPSVTWPICLRANIGMSFGCSESHVCLPLHCCAACNVIYELVA